MTLRNLRIFVTVCSEGNSVTRAARKLFISQPSVTGSIQALEEEVGVPLFERLSKRLYLTEQGKVFLSYAQRILVLYDEMNSAVAGEKEEVPIRVGASLTIGSTLLPSLAEQFLKKVPNAHLTVQIRRSRMLQEMLKSGDLDFALVEMPSRDPLLVAEKFLTSAIDVIAPCSFEKDRITLEELVTSPLILREKGSGTRDYFDSVLASRGFTAKPVWESESPEAILEAVSDGIGLGVLPEGRIQLAVKTGRVKVLQIKEVSFPLEYSFVTHRDKILTTAMQQFRSILFNHGD